jgi:hypothetical protein
MAKTKISEWSATPANNTDIDGINIAEGCAPSGINNAIREMMAQVKDLYAGTTGDATAVAGGGTGATTAAQAKINLAVVTAATGSSIIATGNTGERDGTPAAGYFRFNTTLSKFEGYSGTAWGSVGGGATGGGTDEIFIENGQIVTTNYTIAATRNAMSTGPITVNSGVTVTVSSGARWVVL